MELKDIQNLIKFVAKSGASEVKLEMEDIKITVKTGPEKTETTTILQQSAPVATSQIPVVSQVVSPQADIAKESSEASKESSSEDSKYITIKSPIIGTAYLAAEPGAKKFVEVGDKIRKGQTVMIVEAMKTMNHVPTTSDGEVKKILVEDGQPVEFGQTLVILK